MNNPREPGETDVLSLERSVDCLASVVALRSGWVGRSGSQVSRTLVETLSAGLALDLVYVRFIRIGVEAPMLETSSALDASAERVDATLRERLGSDVKRWPRSDSHVVGGKSLCIATVPLDLRGEPGVLVAASERPGFPTRGEAAVIDASANQLLLGLHELSSVADTSEHYLRLIVDSIPGMVAVFSAAGELETVNDYVLRYFGTTLERLKDWEAGGYTHPDDYALSVDSFRESIATSLWVEHEIRARRFDGTYRWFQSRGAPLRDASGRVVRWCNLLVDVDDRKRAEEAVAASEHNARLIVDSMPGLVGVFSADGVLQAVNKPVLDYFGATLEELKDWRAKTPGSDGLTHVEDHTVSRESVSQSIATGKWVEHDIRARRSDGVYRWFRSLGAPFRDASGVIVRWYNLLIDIDDQKRAESELRRAQSELEQASRAMSLGVLAASIAHEINQPLSGIVTNASTCVKLLAAKPPNVEAALETAQRSIRDGHRASEIVTRLRTLFAKKEFAAAPVDLNEAARAVVALTLNELRRHRVALRLELDQRLPVVTGDHVQLQQVILNLLLNASDAMRSVEDRPRQIVVETAHDTDVVRLAVRDTGVGIAPESLGKLFDPFFTTKADGMGIGLSVSRAIVDRHAGRLWATPNDGPGVTFAFSVPRQGRGS
jgi:PAS domain S-box-containing protein